MSQWIHDRLSVQVQTEKAEKEKRAQDTRRFLGIIGCRSFFTLLCINTAYFLCYLIVMVFLPDSQITLQGALGGGISFAGFGWMFLIAVVITVLFCTVHGGKTRTLSGASAVWRYLSSTGLWYTFLILFFIFANLFYKATLYNKFVGIPSSLLRGPSFLIQLLSTAIAMLMPLVNRIYRAGIPLAFRAILHFCILHILTFICFYTIIDGFSSAAQYLIFLGITALLYGIGCAIFFPLLYAKEKDTNEQQTYDNIYTAPEANRKTDTKNK